MNPFQVNVNLEDLFPYDGGRRAPDSVDIYGSTMLKGKRAKLDNTMPFTPTWVQGGLAGTSDAANTYATRVQNRHLFMANPAKQRGPKDERRERDEKRRSRRNQPVMGKRGTRKEALWKFDPTQAKFKLFLPLHHMWMGYMSELFGLSAPPQEHPTPPTEAFMPSSAGMHAKLVKADFHGSLITVRQSKNSSLVGLSGIVILETESTFKVITKKNQLKVIPKANSIFAFGVPLYSTLGTSKSIADVPPSSDLDWRTVIDQPHMEFELHGNQFCFRSSERAGRKFKHKETIEL